MSAKLKSRRQIFVWAIFQVGISAFPCFLFAQPPASGRNSEPRGQLNASQDAKSPAIAPDQFDGEAAMTMLKSICDLGPRISTSKAMLKQQELVSEHFRQLDGEIKTQPFQVIHPATGQTVVLTNLFVRWHPNRNKRILICCHYDTRPFADRDPVDPQAQFIGANDGASGVGLLSELGRHVRHMDGNYGIDFAFFDGEEFVWVAGRDQMFLGSTYFAQQYAARRWDVKYKYGILIDMIGDADLQIYIEKNSWEHARRLTESIWTVAQQMGIKEFIPQAKHQIRDDHLPLNTIARIPTCDIIDFDYPDEQSNNAYWHTRQDVPENCSSESLQKVGSVLLEWVRQLQKL